MTSSATCSPELLGFPSRWIDFNDECDRLSARLLRCSASVVNPPRPAGDDGAGGDAAHGLYDEVPQSALPLLSKANEAEVEMLRLAASAKLTFASSAIFTAFAHPHTTLAAPSPLLRGDPGATPRANDAAAAAAVPATQTTIRLVGPELRLFAELHGGPLVVAICRDQAHLERLLGPCVYFKGGPNTCYFVRPPVPHRGGPNNVLGLSLFVLALCDLATQEGRAVYSFAVALADVVVDCIAPATTTTTSSSNRKGQQLSSLLDSDGTATDTAAMEGALLARAAVVFATVSAKLQLATYGRPYLLFPMAASHAGRFADPARLHLRPTCFAGCDGQESPRSWCAGACLGAVLYAPPPPVVFKQDSADVVLVSMFLSKQDAGTHCLQTVAVALQQPPVARCVALPSRVASATASRRLALTAAEWPEFVRLAARCICSTSSLPFTPPASPPATPMRSTPLAAFPPPPAAAGPPPFSVGGLEATVAQCVAAFVGYEASRRAAICTVLAQLEALVPLVRPLDKSSQTALAVAYHRALSYDDGVLAALPGGAPSDVSWDADADFHRLSPSRAFDHVLSASLSANKLGGFYGRKAMGTAPIAPPDGAAEKNDYAHEIATESAAPAAASDSSNTSAAWSGSPSRAISRCEAASPIAASASPTDHRSRSAAQSPLLLLSPDVSLRSPSSMGGEAAAGGDGTPLAPAERRGHLQAALKVHAEVSRHEAMRHRCEVDLDIDRKVKEADLREVQRTERATLKQQKQQLKDETAAQFHEETRLIEGRMRQAVADEQAWFVREFGEYSRQSGMRVSRNCKGDAAKVRAFELQEKANCEAMQQQMAREMDAKVEVEHARLQAELQHTGTVLDQQCEVKYLVKIEESLQRIQNQRILIMAELKRIETRKRAACEAEYERMRLEFEAKTGGFYGPMAMPATPPASPGKPGGKPMLAIPTKQQQQQNNSSALVGSPRSPAAQLLPRRLPALQQPPLLAKEHMASHGVMPRDDLAFLWDYFHTLEASHYEAPCPADERRRKQRLLDQAEGTFTLLLLPYRPPPGQQRTYFVWALWNLFQGPAPHLRSDAPNVAFRDRFASARPGLMGDPEVRRPQHFPATQWALVRELYEAVARLQVRTRLSRLLDASTQAELVGLEQGVLAAMALLASVWKAFAAAWRPPRKGSGLLVRCHLEDWAYDTTDGTWCIV